MSAGIRAFSTTVSDSLSGVIRDIRLGKGWSRDRLSKELHDHRCNIHPGGFEMSPAVISTIERGVPSQKGYPRRTRPVTVDELHAFGEVLGGKLAPVIAAMRDAGLLELSLSPPVLYCRR